MKITDTIIDNRFVLRVYEAGMGVAVLDLETFDDFWLQCEAAEEFLAKIADTPLEQVLHEEGYENLFDEADALDWEEYIKEESSLDDLQIYVVDLAEYNAGRETGAWIDCIDKDVEDLETEIKESVLSDLNHEWAIHDSDGFYGSLPSCPTLNDVVDLALKRKQLGSWWELFLKWREELGWDDVEPSKFHELFSGMWPDLKAWAEDLIGHEVDALPENLRGYFNFNDFARDAVLGGDITVINCNSEIAVLWNH